MIRFLHFSDIHFGQESNGRWEPHEDVRSEVLNDLRRMRSESVIDGPADVILVSGDIAQSGLESEYKTASEWLRRVVEIAGGPNTVIRTVPGNHDVNLTTLGASGELAQNALRAEKDIRVVYRYLNELAAQRSPVFSKLDDYRSFANAHGSDFESLSAPYYRTTFEMKGGKSIRLHGLCSVMICDKSDSPGGMVLGAHQFTIERHEECEDIVMMHHPLSWYRDKGHAATYLHSRPRLVITGHEHEFRLERTARLNAHEQLTIAAGALNPPNADSIYSYSYNWIELSWLPEGDNASLCAEVYPRAWNQASTGFGIHPGLQKLSQRHVIDCGRRPASSVAKVSPAVMTNALTDTRAESTDFGPESDLPMPSEEAFQQLSLLFWLKLSKERRVEILIRLGLLTEHARSRLPSSFEREALNDARASGKLSEVWEAMMSELPESERESNPFMSGE